LYRYLSKLFSSFNGIRKRRDITHIGISYCCWCAIWTVKGYVHLSQTQTFGNGRWSMNIIQISGDILTFW